MEVYLAQPRGFCAGVVRAIEIVERALEKYGPPVYVHHEIVHNKFVVESLKNKGAIFVEDLSEVPPRAVTVFSAHGVARSVEEEAAARGLPVLNATCPLVTKVHNQGKRYMSKERALILIGHAGHPEVEGTMGQVPGPVLLVQNVDDVAALTMPADTPVAYITQTTLSVDDTKGHNCGPSPAFYGYSRPGHSGYLLCHTEPPICGKGPEQARGRHFGGGGRQ
jgi:4-hydroxy-3-methylbut-2-en-1-yl diphosphate reductase